MVGKTALGMRLGALLVVMALAAACSGDDAVPESTASTTVATTSTTTTTAPPATTSTTTAATTQAPTTTTSDPIARPEVLVSNFDRKSVDDFDTTGDNLWEVAMELDDLFNFLEGNPVGTGEDMVGMIYERTYPYYESLVEGFSELSAQGWRYVDRGMETTAIEVVSTGADRGEIRLTSRRDEQIIVDAAGTEVRRLPGWELDIATFQIRRGPDGHWRYHDVGEFTKPTAEELSRMVPVEWIGRTS